MIEYVINLDGDVFLWLNSFHNLFWDVFMKIATGRIIWGFFYLAIIIALFRAYGWKTALLMILFSCVAVACADQITASLLRPYFERLRPAHIENPISEFVHIVDGYRGGRFGFPSSHAANTFAAAVFLSLVFKRWRFTVAIFIWAILNCYSRIYLGVHYPGDLLAGIIIGSILGLICFFIANFINNGFRGFHKIGQSDPLLKAYIGGVKFCYRAPDIAILVEFLTILGIFIFVVSLFY